MRAFIAIEIPPAIKEGMTGVRDRLKGAGVDAGWSRPEGVHLTLKFLGEVSEARVPEIMRALALALCGTGRFRLGVEGVGTFPNPASARVVWLGLAGDLKALFALQANVEQAMAGLGLEREVRPYAPHLTLGRVRHVRSPEIWLKRLAGVRSIKLPGFDVTAVSLIASKLGPAGATYRELGRVPL